MPPLIIKKFAIATGIAHLNVACIVRVESATILTVQTNIVVLDQALLVFVEGITQNVIGRAIAHSLFQGSLGVNTPTLDEAKCLIYQSQLMLVH
jgi:hypothetical protein